MGSIQVIEETSTKNTVKHLPRWIVVLHNTDHHTFNFVIALIMTVFNKDMDEAHKLTMEIHEKGRCIATTTHKEKAEMYVELVKGYGADPDSRGPQVPLPCTMEQVDD